MSDPVAKQELHLLHFSQIYTHVQFILLSVVVTMSFFDF